MFYGNKNVQNQNKDNFFSWYYFVICVSFAWFLYRDYILYYYIGFFLSNNENMRRHRYYNKRTRSVFRKWKYNRCGLERCCIRLLRYCRYYTRTHNIFTCSNKKEKNYHRLLCPTPISPKKKLRWRLYITSVFSLFNLFLFPSRRCRPCRCRGKHVTQTRCKHIHK